MDMLIAALMGQAGQVLNNFVQRDEVASLWSVIRAGGITMVPLGILSVLAVMLILIFLVTLRRRAIVSQRYMDSAEAYLRKRDYLGLLVHSNRNGGAVARVMRRMLEFLSRNPNATLVEAREVAQTEGVKQAAALNQQILYLADIGAIAPMLGLFGTVLGMIKAFTVVANDVAATKPMLLANAVAEALVTTATGLLIGIPAMMAYAFFRGRIQALIAELEAASTQLLAVMSVHFCEKASSKQVPPEA